MFKSITGESLGAMIKRLRLEQSAKQLYNISQNITEVGMESGYNTPSSFTKAFRQHFEYSPVDFKTTVANQFKDRYQPLEVEPKIKKLSRERLLCYRVIGDYATSAIEAWENLYKHLKKENIQAIDAQTNYYGLCFDIPGITEDDKIRYEAAISIDSNANIKSDSLFLRELPSGKYATTLHQGDQDELYEYWPRFYRWIQSKKLTLANFAPIERYLDDPAQMLIQMPKEPSTELLVLLS
jgi:AraC family transcriptional regulator